MQNRQKPMQKPRQNIQKPMQKPRQNIQKPMQKPRQNPWQILGQEAETRQTRQKTTQKP